MASQLLETGAMFCCGVRLGAGQLRLCRRDDAMVVRIDDENYKVPMKRRQVPNYLETQAKREIHRRKRVSNGKKK